MTNQQIRTQALERDNNECQLSKLFGIARLSGVPCSKDKEVHHITYKRYDDEQPGDLITVCRQCHEFLTNHIRSLRHSRRSSGMVATITETPREPTITMKKEKKNEDFEVQTYRRSAPTFTQRAVSGPTLQMDEGA